eukprot:6190497-Pleurochrysis_carterae.AAC.2
MKSATVRMRKRVTNRAVAGLSFQARTKAVGQSTPSGPFLCWRLISAMRVAGAAAVDQSKSSDGPLLAVDVFDAVEGLFGEAQHAGQVVLLPAG